jgi:putative copper export protein
MRRLFLIGIAAALLLSMVSMTWATANLNFSKTNVNRMTPGAQLVSASIWVGANQAQTSTRRRPREISS